jgi:hypothetical protein
MYNLASVANNSTAAQLSIKWLCRVFNTYCIFSAVHKTDNDIMCNGSADGNVRSECQEDQDTDCEDGDSDTEW